MGDEKEQQESSGNAQGPAEQKETVVGPTMEVVSAEEYYRIKDEEDFQRVANVFVYHAPKDIEKFGKKQTERYETLRAWAKDMANVIINICPYSRERSLALSNLQQTVMWANASIAINEK